MHPVQTPKLSISGCVYGTDELQRPMEGEGECESERVELLPLCTHLSKYDSTVTGSRKNGMHNEDFFSILLRNSLSLGPSAGSASDEMV